MRKPQPMFLVVLVAAATLLTIPGCGKKAVQSGGDTTQASLAAAGEGGSRGASGGGTDSGRSGVGNFPDTSMQSSSGGGLIGLDKNPSEERVTGGFGSGSQSSGGPVGEGVGSGTLLAKADPSGSAGRQMDEIRAEQAASAAAGLRDVYFGYDSWTINEEGRQALGRDAEWMKSNPGIAVKIEGHCDERGTSAYNLVLGEKRAKAVRNYLVELGIGANRLSVVSYGKERPFCNDHAEACYQQNRRGHLVVKSKK